MRSARAFGASNPIVKSTFAASLFLGACLAFAGSSCSASGGGSSHNGFGGDSSGSNAGGNGSGNGSSSLGNGGGLSGALVGAGGGMNGAGGGSCASNKTKAMAKPLDMYIMLDQSGSMSDAVPGGTKWSAVTQGISNFVNLPGAAGLGVGLGYFGVPAGGGSCPSSCDPSHPCGTGCGPCFLHMCLGGGSGSDSCNASDYAIPAIEISTLPGPNNMQADAITMSMSAHGPSTSTPTGPALQGAIDHAKSWAMTNPSHVVIAVLATDGDPSECNPQDIPSISGIAQAGVTGTPSILTFVIGVGNSTANLNAIAMGGGTTSAFIIDTSMNVTQQFLDALNQIRGASLGCVYQIPMPGGMKPDFNKVNVEYTPGGSNMSETIPNVQDLADCPPNMDAWYYDDNANPTEIIMCPFTCQKLSADSTGEVDIAIGCKTVVVPH
jgi:hypothetical protein